MRAEVAGTGAEPSHAGVNEVHSFGGDCALSLHEVERMHQPKQLSFPCVSHIYQMLVSWGSTRHRCRVASFAGAAGLQECASAPRWERKPYCACAVLRLPGTFMPHPEAQSVSPRGRGRARSTGRSSLLPSPPPQTLSFC